MLKILSIFIFSVFFFFCICESNAQPPPPTDPPPCWPPPCIPIDGGICFLIAAGAALAGKKFYDFRKKVNR